MSGKDLCGLLVTIWLNKSRHIPVLSPAVNCSLANFQKSLQPTKLLKVHISRLQQHLSSKIALLIHVYLFTIKKEKVDGHNNII